MLLVGIYGAPSEPRQEPDRHEESAKLFSQARELLALSVEACWCEEEEEKAYYKSFAKRLRTTDVFPVVSFEPNKASIQLGEECVELMLMSEIKGATAV